MIEKLTEEENADMIDFAVEKAKQLAVNGKITVQGVVGILKHFHVESPDAFQIAKDLLLADGFQVCSNS